MPILTVQLIVQSENTVFILLGVSVGFRFCRILGGNVLNDTQLFCLSCSQSSSARSDLEVNSTFFLFEAGFLFSVPVRNQSGEQRK